MQLTKSIQILKAPIFHLFLGFGFYFTIINTLVAETLVIGSSKNAIKIEKLQFLMNRGP